MTYVEHAGLLRDDVRPEVGAAIRRRILVAQALYLTGFLISLLPSGTTPAIVFIVLVQLNFAIAPRIWFLHKI